MKESLAVGIENETKHTVTKEMAPAAPADAGAIDALDDRPHRRDVPRQRAAPFG